MINNKGFTGISFPFRIGNRGGLVMSSTSRYEVPHIIESIQQILGTKKRERVMELHFGSDIDFRIFEENDTTTHTLIKYQILETLEEFEPRILVEGEDIEIWGKDEKVFATIDFVVIKFHSNHTVVVELGGTRNEK